MKNKNLKRVESGPFAILIGVFLLEVIMGAISYGTICSLWPKLTLIHRILYSVAISFIVTFLISLFAIRQGTKEIEKEENEKSELLRFYTTEELDKYIDEKIFAEAEDKKS